MDKDVVCIYVCVCARAHTHTHTMEYYSAIKRNEIMPFASTWMELEIIILSEVKSGRERQIPYDITYVWNLKYGTGASLVVQWLRIHLPMQGTRVRAVVREDPICRRATKPGLHNY